MEDNKNMHTEILAEVIIRLASVENLLVEKNIVSKEELLKEAESVSKEVLNVVQKMAEQDSSTVVSPIDSVNN